jgi:hypothetical protein
VVPSNHDIAMAVHKQTEAADMIMGRPILIKYNGLKTTRTTISRFPDTCFDFRLATWLF